MSEQVNERQYKIDDTIKGPEYSIKLTNALGVEIANLANAQAVLAEKRKWEKLKEHIKLSQELNKLNTDIRCILEAVLYDMDELEKS